MAGYLGIDPACELSEEELNKGLFNKYYLKTKTSHIFLHKFFFCPLMFRFVACSL